MENERDDPEMIARNVILLCQAFWMYRQMLLMHMRRRRNARLERQRRIRERRRRFRLFFMRVALILENPRFQERRARRYWIKQSSRSSDWSSKLLNDEWEESDYFQNLRLNKNTFLYLCNAIGDRWRRLDTNMRLCVPLKLRVAMALYYLADNASFRTLQNLFGYGKSTCCKVIHEFCSIVNTHLLPQFITYPNEETFFNMADEFERTYDIPNCVGSIDGTHLPIWAPSNDQRNDFYNRKGWYSIVMQGTVDANGRFWDVSVGWPGSVHDARAFSDSALYTRYVEGRLFPNYHRNINGVDIPLYIIGDGAYPLQEWLMTPFCDSPRLTEQHIFYNRTICGARSVVEHAFGRLKGRWRCLLSTNMCKLENVKKLALTCCVLHNMCEVRGIPFADIWLEDITQLDFLPRPLFEQPINRQRGVRVRNALVDYVNLRHNTQ